MYAEQYDYRGMTIKIEYDDSPESPREWDNLGTMVCWHSGYNLGDEKISRDEALAQYKQYSNPKKYLCLPLYLYLYHSGIAMNTTGFACPWDSGQVGFIYISYDKIRKEYGNTTTETLDKVHQYLKNEVKTYDQYLRGEVYGFTVETKEGDHLDSLWGFYSLDDCKAEAESIAKTYVSDSAWAQAERVSRLVESIAS